MKTILIYILISTSLLSYGKTKVVLKLDDLRIKNGSNNFETVIKFLLQRKIKASFGAIANDLDESAYESLKEALNAKNEKKEQLFEFWNHGFDHKNPEFKGTPYEYQKKHFDDATQVINQKLKIELHTFGAPFNALDSLTDSVILQDNRYKIVFFRKTNQLENSKITCLNNKIYMETGTGNVNFNRFLSDYESKSQSFKEYFVLEGHPFAWNQDNRMEEFEKILNFLIERDCEFVLPMELYNK